MAPSLGGIVASPAANLFWSWLATRDYKDVNAQYNADIDQQYADALAEAEAIARNSDQAFGDDYGAAKKTLQGAGGRARADAQRIVREATRLYGNRADRVLGDFDRNSRATSEASRRGYNRLEGRYGQREADILGEMEGLGDQEKKDIADAWAEIEAKNLGFINERGLGNSNVIASERRRVREGHGDEVGRANERLRRERIGAMTGLSGDTLALAERGQNVGTDQGNRYADSRAYYDASLSGDTASARLNAMNNAANTGYMSDAAIADFEREFARLRNANYLDTTGQHLGIVTGFDRVPPTQPNVGQFGANSAQVPSPPKWYEYMFGPAAQGIGTGLGAATAASFFSDRRLKSIIRQIGRPEADIILRKIETLPVSRWKYLAESGLDQDDHIGPMAQDFGAAVFDDPEATKINPVDAHGVLLIAIQALAAQVRDLQAKVRSN